MPNQIKIIQDISLLYELSLSVGSSLDPYENCHNFLRTLISRKSLNFGAVWLHRPEEGGGSFCDLFFIHPHFRESERMVACSHFIIQELTEKPYLTIPSYHPYFEDVLHEKKIGKGSYAIFKLGDLGFLKLFASNRPDGFPEMEMAQLKQVVDKLKVSLDGCFAHIHLKAETEQRLKTQKALEEGENMLRRIIDSSQDAVVSIDADGKAVEWSTQAEKMFGFSRQEAIGQEVRLLIIPERQQQNYHDFLLEYLNMPDECVVNRRFEIKCRRKDDSQFPAELSFTVDRNNKDTLFVGLFRDITEQRKNKMEIEQARIRMANLIANLQSGILLVDEQGKIALVNKSFCDLFEISGGPKSLIGVGCSDSAAYAKSLFMDPEGFIQGIDRVLGQNCLVENETLYMTNGKVLERDFIPLVSGGRPQGQLWQYRDVTERQNAEKAIRESEEKYRGVLENMELGLLEVDLEERITRTNNAFCQMTGYTQEELLGCNAAQLLLPESSHSAMAQRTKERNKGQSGVYEIQLRKKDGTPLWGLISGAPIRNQKGEIVGSIGIHFDLTERKKLEHALAEAKMAADRARLAERQFLTHMSHEIRTPINAVIGMTHLLYDTRPDPLQEEYLNSLRFSADSLLGIIDNILDLSKIDAGEIEFEQKPFDLGYQLNSLLHSFQFKMEEKDIRLDNYFDPQISNLVVGDPTRLNQILTNLLGNALKFTEKGAVSLSTRLTRRSAEHYWIEFQVRDTGIGIPRDKWDTIFEYFKQADVQINRKFGGTGLGLTIVKQLIEMQGGQIHVESKIGEGSNFIFSLRFGNSGIPVEPNAVSNDRQQLLAAGKGLAGLRILIVEDNLLNQKLICKTIETWEGSFEVANNGLEALAKTAESRFDAILMDIHMPEMDGCETTLAIRKDRKNPNRDIPIIALTAAAMADEKRRAFEVGMNGFLTKPISPRVLQENLIRTLPKLNLPDNYSANTPIEPAESPEQEGPDLSYLLEMSNGDHHFVRQIVDAFLEDIPSVLQQMEFLCQNSQWEPLGKLAHKIKPNYAMLGMKQLHQQALALETAVKKGDCQPGQLHAMNCKLVADTRRMLPRLSEKNKS